MGFRGLRFCRDGGDGDQRWSSSHLPAEDEASNTQHELARLMWENFKELDFVGTGATATRDGRLATSLQKMAP